MPVTAPTLDTIDAFDLPEWLGEGEVVWTPKGGLGRSFHAPGVFTADEKSLDCALLAVDEAYPVPVTDNDSRTRVHQNWRYGQILVAEYDGNLVIAVPGTRITPDLTLEALIRFAKAVGAQPSDYAAMLRITEPSSR